MKTSLKFLSGIFLLGVCAVAYAAQGAATQFRPLAAASKQFSRAVAAARAAETNPYVRKPIKTKVKIRPFEMTPLLYNPVSEVIKLSERPIGNNLVYGAYMLENLRGKDAQGNPAPLYATQDRLFVGEVFGKTMFALCDGHGAYGHKIAENIMHTVPLQVFNSSDTQQGFKKACKAAQEKFLKNAYAQQSGSTFVAGVIHNKLLTVANLGDSRLLVVRPSEGMMPFATRDHKSTLDEYTQRGLAITRTFGDVDICRKWNLSSTPDVTQVKLVEGDYVVIASDGYWDAVSNKETYDFITNILKARTACSCKDIAQQLTQEARNRGSRDDISAFVVRYGASSTAAPAVPAG